MMHTMKFTLSYPVRILLLLLLTLQTTLQAADKVYTTENIPKVHLQDRSRYTCNPDGILSPAACDSIDRMLFALEETTGIETVVAVVGSIGQEDCFQFAHKLFNDWGVGKKKNNNGLVVLLVLDQRYIQFVTGLGLEGDLPDALCKRIQMKYMFTPFKQGDWDSGMVAGIKAVCATLDGTMEAEPEEEEDFTSILILLACIIGVSLFCIVWAIYSSTKCPHCGKHKLQRSSSRLLYRRGGVKKEEVIYTCLNCGHVVRRTQSSYDEHYKGNGGHGPIIFGGMGGGGFSGGGGGFGGGSFGGGFSGGGGAGTRF